MSRNDWPEIIACLASYFPTMVERLTEPQAQAWQKLLQGLELDRIRASIKRAYTAHANEWPTPSEIAQHASDEKKFVGTYKPIDGNICTIEENKRQCRIGMEQIRQRIAARGSGQPAGNDGRVGGM
jgi:hypothetical protein